MEKRPLGKTGISVTPLGFGSAQLGYLAVPQAECDQLLNGLLDAGINLIDTAECYHDSEEKVGRAVGHRRAEYVLATKTGHAVKDIDAPAWSPELIAQTAARSLKRLKTDHVDLIQIHSCPLKELRNDKMIEALAACKEKGQTRFIGYSGDNEDLAYAIRMGIFDCIETSLSICDQQVLEKNIPMARDKKLGVLTKRSVANACWRGAAELGEIYSGYARPYIERLKEMNFTPQSLGFNGSWLELALRFTAWQPGVTSALVGGRNLEHLVKDITIVDHGPLSEEIQKAIRETWNRHAQGKWAGQT